MINIMIFSIKVASDMGSFKAVPRQAHEILFLFNKESKTPIVVIDNTINVTHKAMSNFQRIKKRTPRTVSKNG